ncbi:MAG: glycosyltransferase family 4 protein [Verrucomicrobia bacterium]|nr:glycosyltransferase family 4 protein [Verrucomicrobiota bacterium]
MTEFTPRTARPKILQIFSRYREYGGEEASVFRIGDALQHDFDTGFYLASSEDALAGELPQKLAKGMMAFWNWEAVRDLKRLQKLGGYDCWLVHNIFPMLSPAVYTLAFRLGIPVVQYLHNYRFGCVNGFFLNHGEPCQLCMRGNFLPALRTACWQESHLKSGLMGAVTARARGADLFHRISRWVAVSEAQKYEHVAMGIPEEKISVIPHFYEAQAEPPAYPEGGDVLFAGRLSREKGVDRLLKAWSRVQDTGRALWIVGEGPEREALQKLAVTQGLRNVRFTGFLEQSEMCAIWEKAACSVVPSIWKEPFGMVVLEAWAKGRPIVAHRIGSLPELITDGADGMLVSPESPEDLASALCAILNNPERGAAMGRTGLNKVRESYSKELWQKRMEPVFEVASRLGNRQNLS